MNARLALALGFLATLTAGASVAPQAKDVRLWMREDGSMQGPFADAMQRRSPIAFAPAEFGGGTIFNARDDAFVANGPLDLPAMSFSVGATVSVETPRRWGGIIGAVEDNGGYEKGWILGYDEERFTFGLSTEATDDGDGRLIYLRADKPYEVGRLYNVSAHYDGTVAKLLVNGRVAAVSEEVGGAIVHAEEARLAIGAYRDSNEHHPHDGRIKDVGVKEDASPGLFWAKRLTGFGKFDGPWTDTAFGWSVAPYLTWPRPNAISVLAETTWPSSATVRIRRDDAKEWTEIRARGESERLHEVRITGLAPATKHFYQVVAVEDAANGSSTTLESPVRSFRTAPDSDDAAFTFAVIGDTQTNGEVAKRVSDLAFEQRPNFVVHCGDLVDTGGNKTDWTDTFFPNMRPLLEHAPLVPVLGNHEQDARLYYDYMSLPEPEKWYSLRYGCAEFFLIDGNRSLAERSEQLAWLDGALQASTARWRFAVLHQPPYTSDSNDYGDTAEGPSTRGDMNVRNIVALLERYGVDVCFSGHVHDYERTFPIKGGAVVPHAEGGVVYVTSAGGGGPLEDFDGTNTTFGHKKARRHHFVQVAIHADVLEMHTVDEQGRVIDVMTLRDR